MSDLRCNSSHLAFFGNWSCKRILAHYRKLNEHRSKAFLLQRCSATDTYKKLLQVISIAFNICFYSHTAYSTKFCTQKDINFIQLGLINIQISLVIYFQAFRLETPLIAGKF